VYGAKLHFEEAVRYQMAVEKVIAITVAARGLQPRGVSQVPAFPTVLGPAMSRKVFGISQGPVPRRSTGTGIRDRRGWGAGGEGCLNTDPQGLGSPD